jgi:endonuclease/exonuclease/phosphatase (EEP) superfamily protein YafD
VALSVVTANLWRDNPQIGRDLTTLLSHGADLIGCNEAAGFADEIEAACARFGYTPIATTGRRAAKQNPVLVKGGVVVHDREVRTISRAVGDSPERTGIAARCEVGGAKVALLNVHMNSHVQAGAAKPHDLPRVREYVAAMKVLTAWVRELRAEGYRVIVTGDLNWSWSSRAAQWAFSPVRVFGQLGMVSQYDYGVLPRPKGDERPIEYVLFDPREFAYAGQRFVGPEKSDHPWHEVDLTIKESA